MIYNVENIDKKSFEEIIDKIKKNKIFLSPTDTIWGLHGNYYNKDVYKKIQKIKKRDLNKNFIAITDNIEKIKNIILPEKIKIFLDKIWPGEITAILRTQDNSTIAIRIPRHNFLLKILSNLDFPLISTSANISGVEISENVKDIIDLFKNKVDFILKDNRDKITPIPSTIIDLTEEDNIKLIREGYIPFNTIKDIWDNI